MRNLTAYITILLVFQVIACKVLQAQSWELQGDYPLKLPGGIRVVDSPDSIATYLKAENGVSPKLLYQNSQQFHKLSGAIELSKGTVLWQRFSLVNIANKAQRYLMEADSRETDWSEVDVYLFEGDSVNTHTQIGNNIRPVQRKIRDARNFFWWEADSAERIDVLIRYKSAFNATRPPPSVRVYDRTTLQDFQGVSLASLPKNPIRAWAVASALPVLYSKEFVIDSLGLFRFEELKKQWDQYAEYFLPNRESIVVKHPLWCRIKVINPLNRPQSYFFTPSGDSPEIIAYLPDGNGNYSEARTGMKVPLGEKQIAHHVSFLQFELSARDSGYIFLRYAPFHKIVNDFHTSYSTPVLFLDRNEVLQRIRILGVWKGFIIGIILFEIIYFALRAIFERDRLWFFYLLVIIGFLLFFVSVENIRNTFLAFRLFFDFNPFIFAFSSIFSALGLFLFSNQFLSLRKNQPWMVKVLIVVLILIIGVQFASLSQELIGEYRQAENPDAPFFYHIPFHVTGLLLFGITLLLYIIMAVFGIVRHQTGAKSYLIAFAPISLAGLYIVFKHVFVSRLSLSEYNFYYASSIVSHVLFALVVAHRNNTARLKQLEAEAIIRVNEAKSEFYDHISHEFRTPLTIIQGVSRMIRGNEEEKGLIQKNSQEVLQLVDRLIGFSKTQAGVNTLQMVEEDIVSYLEYLTEAMQPFADQYNIKLELSYDKPVIEFAFDKEKIKLIYNNLVSNAIKFTQPEGEVRIIAGIKEHQFLLSVEDNGIGISSENLSRIFDRYFQSEQNKNSDKGEGGIGLALVKDFVTMMGGRIEVTSTEGKGSIFVVLLPFEPLSYSSNKLKDAAKQILDDAPLLLIVEDHADVQYYLKRLLSHQYRIETASNGKEGFDMAVTFIPDLIISDVVMPKMNGYKMTSQIKADLRTSHIPVILLTAKSKHEEKLQGLEGGADAYLVKPFEEDELLLRIQKLIESRQKLRELFTHDLSSNMRMENTDPFIEKARDLLKDNFQDENFGIQEFAFGLHLSRMQVHRKLKAITGESASQFINRFRLEKGKEMLIRKDLGISEVAYECGFSDPGYFGKLFTKSFGLSPQRFQQSQQK